MAESIAKALWTVEIIGLALAICIFLEFAFPRTRYSLRDRFPGVLFIFILPLFSVLAIRPLQIAWEALGVGPIADISDWHPSAIFGVSLFVRDLFSYLGHRFDHWVLWPIHAVHHSPNELHAANGYGHPLQAFTELLFIAVPLSMIDFGGLVWPIAATLLVSVQSQITHSPLRIHLGPLRRIFVDSRFHRIHHSLEPRHFDRNFGTVFTIWDQLFGTAYFPAEDEWPEVGVAGLSPPRTIRQYLFHPLRHFREGPAAHLD